MDKLINDFKISYTKGDTYALAIKFKSLSEDLRTAFFTVKENPDDEPLIQKTLGAGIAKIDDRAYKNEKTYKLQIQAEDTANLEAHVQYLYDLQVAVGNVVKTVISGVFVVTHSLSGNASAFGSTLEVAIDDKLETELETIPATRGIEYETDPVANAKIGDMAKLSTEAKGTLVQAVNEAKNGVNSNAENINKILNGTIKPPLVLNAERADYATSAGRASMADYATSAGEANQANNAIYSTHATQINGLRVEADANGVLKIGDVIIPQKKLLFTSESGVLYKDLSDLGLEDGDTIEVEFYGALSEICKERIKLYQDYTKEIFTGFRTSNEGFPLNTPRMFFARLKIENYSLTIYKGTWYWSNPESKTDGEWTATAELPGYAIIKIYKIIE